MSHTPTSGCPSLPVLNGFQYLGSQFGQRTRTRKWLCSDGVTVSPPGSLQTQLLTISIFSFPDESKHTDTTYDLLLLALLGWYT